MKDAIIQVFLRGGMVKADEQIFLIKVSAYCIEALGGG